MSDRYNKRPMIQKLVLWIKRMLNAPADSWQNNASLLQSGVSFSACTFSR